MDVQVVQLRAFGTTSAQGVCGETVGRADGGRGWLGKLAGAQ